MRIAEIYQSIQGEGVLTGTHSVFVRTSGCNLRCVYCDTPYASWNPEGDDYSVDEIIEEMGRVELEHAVLTGGEPMLFAELVPLCERLRAQRKHITIETAGTLYLPLECDLMSISPKLSNSTPSSEEYPRWHQRHEASRYVPNTIRRLIQDYEYQFKFVIADPADIVEVEEYLVEFPEIDRDRVLLMPEGCDPTRLQEIQRWLDEDCQRLGFTVCPRRQIEWFGSVRGT